MPSLASEKSYANGKRDAWSASENAEQIAHQTGQKMREYIDTASDELAQATDKVTSQIRSNPVQASVIALGAGFLLGALFRR